MLQACFGTSTIIGWFMQVAIGTVPMCEWLNVCLVMCTESKTLPQTTPIPTQHPHLLARPKWPQPKKVIHQVCAMFNTVIWFKVLFMDMSFPIHASSLEGFWLPITLASCHALALTSRCAGHRRSFTNILYTAARMASLQYGYIPATVAMHYHSTVDMFSNLSEITSCCCVDRDEIPSLSKSTKFVECQTIFQSVVFEAMNIQSHWLC